MCALIETTLKRNHHFFSHVEKKFSFMEILLRITQSVDCSTIKESTHCFWFPAISRKPSDSFILLPSCYIMHATENVHMPSVCKETLIQGNIYTKKKVSSTSPLLCSSEEPNLALGANKLANRA